MDKDNNNVIPLDEYIANKFMEEAANGARKKEPFINLSIDFILNFAVDYTLELQNKADGDNIKACLRLILDRYKEDYEEVNIIF